VSHAGVPPRRERLTKLVSAAVFLAIVAVALAVVVNGSKTGGATKLEEIAQVAHLLRGVPQRGTTLGSPKAKPILVEFGDLQCPVCKAYSEEVLPRLIEGPVRQGEARIQFRNFTILGPQSTAAGAAAIAAGEQGHGWSYIELFYRNQGQEDSGYVTDAFLRAIARAAGVPDIARWERDRQSEPVLGAVAQTTEEAEHMGLSGTPSFAVEVPATAGIVLEGTTKDGIRAVGEAPSLAELEAAIGAARSRRREGATR
jgi:protein-disulfide isomerase